MQWNLDRSQRGRCNGIWIVHSLIYICHILLLREILDMPECNSSSFAFHRCDLANYMIVCPVDELAHGDFTTGLETATAIDGIEHCFPGSLALLFRSTVLHLCTWCQPEATRQARNLLEQQVELLRIDPSILVDIYITEGQSKVPVKLPLLLLVALGGLRDPLLEGSLIVPPCITKCCMGAGGTDGRESGTADRGTACYAQHGVH